MKECDGDTKVGRSTAVYEGDPSYNRNTHRLSDNPDILSTDQILQAVRSSLMEHTDVQIPAA